MTAMMAFFLVMWLINSTDKKTLTQVATYFNPLRLTDKAARRPGRAAETEAGSARLRIDAEQRRAQAAAEASRQGARPSRTTRARARGRSGHLHRGGAVPRSLRACSHGSPTQAEEDQKRPSSPAVVPAARPTRSLRAGLPAFAAAREAAAVGEAQIPSGAGTTCGRRRYRSAGVAAGGRRRRGGSRQGSRRQRGRTGGRGQGGRGQAKRRPRRSRPARRRRRARQRTPPARRSRRRPCDRGADRRRDQGVHGPGPLRHGARTSR